MTQEEKNLLLQDLCARLSYGVMCRVDDGASGLNDGKLVEIDISKELVRFDVDYYWDAYIDDIKPYLRPISSMTEEEKKEFDDFCVIDEFACAGNSEIGYRNQAIIMSDGIDYLNSIHVDYRGLIDMGLALEAPKDMYRL